MHYSSLILFIVAAFNFFLSVFIYLRNKGKKINTYFAITVLAIAIWCVSIAFFRAADGRTIFFWGQVVYFAINFTTTFFLYFTFVFPQGDFPRNKKVRILLILLPLIVFIVTLIPKSIIKDAVVENGQSMVTLGWGYYVHSTFTVFAFVWAFVNLVRKFRKSFGNARQQLIYLFIGTIITASIGIFTNVILFFWTTDYNWVGPSGSIVMVSFIAYAITRYRLLDIRLIVARTIAFGSIVFTLSAIFAIVSALLAFFLKNLFSIDKGIYSDIISGVIISILVASSYRPMVRWIERLTDKFLFKKSYNQDELLSEISDVAARYIQMDKLSSSIYKILDEAFHFEKFGISLLESDGKLKIIYKKGFKVNEAEKLVAYPDLAAIFAKELKVHKGSLVIEEMMTRYENKEFEPVDAKLLKVVHHNNIAVAIPLYVKNNLIGMMVLGSKKSGDPYTQQDINVLEIIGGQMAVAIDNARLYEELRYFNLKLEEEVREKTKQLRFANEDLQKLDKAKSEFISIASHQLRTPLTVIKGYISMMKEGSFGPIRPKILQNLDKVYVSNERLITLVENLLDISRIESGRQEFAWKKIQLEDLAAEVTEKLQDSAKKKKLKLTFHNPSAKLPSVIIDDGKIHEVMMNFVDNAVKYTDKGKVDVFVKKEKEFITFCVKDTGKGISEEGKKKLFQKFSRGKDSFRQHTEGLGLGLYVATMMMKAHGGRIWADSPGEGMGSEFCFSIPVKSGHKDGEISKIDERVVQEANEQEKKEVLAE